MSPSMSSSSQQTYPLSRNTLAATRLDLQHFLWTTTTGHHLHPRITLPPNTQIADIGSGTGIWSLTLPLPPNTNIAITALDISLSQLPPSSWLPSHISSRQLDIFTDSLPEDLIGKFDIIHVRLFLLVVRNNDPLPILRNLLKLLKSGGWLQWGEWDAGNSEVVVAAAAAGEGEGKGKGSAMREFHRLTTGSIGKAQKEGGDKVFENLSWVSTFASLFDKKPNKEEGFVNAELIAQSSTTVPEYLLPLAQEIGFLGAREYVSGLKETQPEAAEVLERVVGEAERECWELRRVTAVRSGIVEWVLRKNDV